MGSNQMQGILKVMLVLSNRYSFDFVQVVIVHILVVYSTFTGEWYTVFHWVSKDKHVMWYTCSDFVVGFMN